MIIEQTFASTSTQNQRINQMIGFTTNNFTSDEVVGEMGIDDGYNAFILKKTGRDNKFFAFTPGSTPSGSKVVIRTDSDTALYSSNYHLLSVTNSFTATAVKTANTGAIFFKSLDPSIKNIVNFGMLWDSKHLLYLMKKTGSSYYMYLYGDSIHPTEPMILGSVFVSTPENLKGFDTGKDMFVPAFVYSTKTKIHEKPFTDLYIYSNAANKQESLSRFTANGHEYLHILTAAVTGNNAICMRI